MTIAIVGTAALGGAAAAPVALARPKAAATTATAAEDTVKISAEAQEVQQATAVQVRLLRNEGQFVPQIATQLKLSASAVQSYLWVRRRLKRRASYRSAGESASTAQRCIHLARVRRATYRSMRIVAGALPASSVDLIFFRRRGIALFVEFVLCFQPIFQGVSAVNSAVTLMDLVRAPLDFVQSVGVLVFGVIFGIAQGESGLDDIGAYNFI
jgi:hypothetical protein